MPRTVERLLFVITILLGIVFSAFVARSTAPATPTRGPVSVASFVPSSSKFCLTNSRGIIHSYYGNEASLIGYHYPVDDIDMMLPAAAQELVCLPGDSRNIYYFYGSERIGGSGLAELWGTSTGGRFAFLHMSRSWVGLPAPRALKLRLNYSLNNPRKCSQSCNFSVGDENTAKVVAALESKFTKPTATVFHGGNSVGYSGWPSSYEFSNGSCYSYVTCELDAHLCLVLDSLSDQFFYHVIFQGPKPPGFNHKLWNHYRDRHHLKRISEYYKGKFSWFATLWAKGNNRWTCQGVVNKAQWNAKGGYLKERFQGCSIYGWPHKNIKPKIVKEKWKA